MTIVKLLTVLTISLCLFSCNENTIERKREYSKMITGVHNDVTDRWIKVAEKIKKSDSLMEEHFVSVGKLNTYVLGEISKLDSISAPKDGDNLKTAMKSQLYYLSDGCKTFRKNYYYSRSVYTKYEIDEWLNDNTQTYMRYVKKTEEAQENFTKVEKQEKKPLF